MPRARNIKPSFFRNPDLAEIEPVERLLFIGLWTMADREGRLEDRPRYIKFELLPSDAFDIDGALNSLQDRGFIIRYEHEANRFIQVINFVKHQNPHVKEAPSTIPAPVKHDASTVQATLNPESPLLNADDTGKPDGSEEETGLTMMEGGKAPTPTERRFDRFWAAYPKKRHKQDAFKAWQRIKAGDDLTDQIITALEYQKTHNRDWKKDQGQFIPYPASWINAGGWEDEDGIVLAATGTTPAHWSIPDL
jgi:hypothetical protein